MTFNTNIKIEKEHFQLKETIVTIIAENNNYIDVAKNKIRKCRSEIEQYIQNDGSYETSLKPYCYSDDSPEIIRKMCDSSEKLN